VRGAVGRRGALRGEGRPRAPDRRRALGGAPYGGGARGPRGGPPVMLAPIKQALRRWAQRPRAVGPAAPVASVAVNMRPTESAWGGGNQWLAQIVRYLAARGYAGRFDLAGPVDGIVMVDPAGGGLVGVGPGATAC